MIHRSKKDAWLLALVWASVLGPLAVAAACLLAPGGNAEAGRAALGVGVTTGAVLLILTYPLNYEITETHLVARSGVMRWKVPLSSIEEVRPSRNPASAPAWSLDRLKVTYLKDAAARSLYVSPEDKGGFLRDLADRTPGLQVQGDRAARVL